MVIDGPIQATRPEVTQQTIEPGVAAVEVRGELDLATVGTLEASVERVLAEASALLLIDFTGCEFIDCSVVSLLLGLHARLRKSRGPRMVILAEEQPLRVLRLTQLDREMSVFESLPEPIESP